MLSSQTVIPQIDTLSPPFPSEADKAWFTYLLQDYLAGRISPDEVTELLTETL